MTIEKKQFKLLIKEISKLPISELVKIRKIVDSYNLPVTKKPQEVSSSINFYLD